MLGRIHWARRYFWPGTLVILVILILNSLYSLYGYDSSYKRLTLRLNFEPVRSIWTHRPQQYLVSKYMRLPSSKPVKIPRIQHDFGVETDEDRETRLQRLEAVREHFKHAWDGYKAHAWGKDEVSPLTGHYNDWFGGWAATMVDSLDTMWIMGFADEFKEAVDFVAGLNFSTSTVDQLNTFETNIRFLGGMLSAYDLSGDNRLLRKALELGEMLYVAFDTPNRLPITRWKWKESDQQSLLSYLS